MMHAKSRQLHVMKQKEQPMANITDNAKLKLEIARLDMEICEKMYELEDLQRKHSELLDELHQSTAQTG
jgi:hypothetical protein